MSGRLFLPFLWGRATCARVLRGGSWNNNERNARCAYRNDNEPDNFNNNIGFRVCAMTLGYEKAGVRSCSLRAGKAIGLRTMAGARPRYGAK